MKTISSYLAFTIIITLFFISCSKEEEVGSINKLSTQNVSLEIGTVLNDFAYETGSRTPLNQIPDCNDEAAPAVARLTLTFKGITKTADVNILTDGTRFYTDYSEDLEIPVTIRDDGDSENDFTRVRISKLLIYDGDPNDAGNLIWVAPSGDGDLRGYVANPLPLDIIVRPGTKKYENIEVLCFDQRMANEYGFPLFDLNPQKLYKLCFFANYCHENGRHYPANYSLDLFVLNAEGERIQLYNHNDANARPEIGQYESGEYFAKPLCVVVPAPPRGFTDNQDYLFYTITLENSDAYGAIKDIVLAEEGLNWNDVTKLFNVDSMTNEYIHVFINCDPPIECGAFEAIPESSFYSELKPENPVDYFEIVNYLDEILYSFSQGNLCTDAVDVLSCTNEFNNLIAEDGFYISCRPEACYTFIRHQTAGVNELVTTDEELREFLGTIDSKGDALLYALSNDYYWSTNDIENGAIKEACTGYELIVNKIISYCAPLQINRFHLKISPSGEIDILEEEVVFFEEDVCI